MDFAFSPEEEAYQAEVRAFIERALPPERLARHLDLTDQNWADEELDAAFRKELSASGLTEWQLPVEHGGRGLEGAYNAILSYEMARARAPVVLHSVYIIGPSLMAFGSDEQRAYFLPKIARGEAEFSLCYSEPGAGSDLAAVETRAVADGDDFVITGQKVFTTAAHRVGYCWLLARTNPDVPKHRGLSLFVFPSDTPGVTIRAIKTIAGWRHSEVFFDTVRVPRSSLVGEEDRGWYHLVTALDFERSGFLYYGEAQRLLDDLLAYCRSTNVDGRPLTEQPDVRRKLAQMRIEMDVGIRFVKRIVWMQSNRRVPNVEASINKVWATEMLQRMSNLGTQIMGLHGTLMPSSPYAPQGGILPHKYLETVRSTISIGANEVQRNIIAQRGLNLPR